MQVVSVINQKGGAGKSTLSIHLAVAAAQKGQNVALIDLDGQATAAEWGDRRDEELPVVVSCHASRLQRELEDVRGSGGELVFIDTVPRSDAVALDAARASDLVIIPCEPNILEVAPTITTVGLLRTTKTPFIVVLNKVAFNGVEADDAEAYLKSEHHIPVSPARVHTRKAFWRAITAGQGVTEYEPDGKAAEELQHLHELVRAHLHTTTRAATRSTTEEKAHAQH